MHFQEAQHQILSVESVDPASWHRSFDTLFFTKHLHLYVGMQDVCTKSEQDEFRSELHKQRQLQ